MAAIFLINATDGLMFINLQLSFAYNKSFSLFKLFR